MQKTSVRFGLKQAFGVAGLFVLITSVASVAVMKLLEMGFPALGVVRTALLGMLVGQVVTLVLLVYRERSLRRLENGQWQSPQLPRAIWGSWILAIVGFAAVSSEVGNYLLQAWPMSKSFREAMAPLTDADEHWIMALLVGVVLGPLVEEVIFRGVVLRGLTATMGAWPAILWSAALFAMIHLNPWQGYHAFGLGVLFGWAYLRTGSLALCIVAHVVNNALSLFLPMLPPWIPGVTGRAETGVILFQPWWFTLMGAVVFVVAFARFGALTANRSAVASDSDNQAGADPAARN